MPNSNSILLTLNIEEPNIHFDEECLKVKTIKDTQSLVYTGTLTYNTPDICPICGCANHNHSIVKNGTKSSMIVLPKVSRMDTYLKLRKQRWLCRDCNQTFTANTDIVEKNCFISKNTKLGIIIDSKKKLSQKDIAEIANVSHGTVNSILCGLYEKVIIKKNYLPKNICFDEFKSVKNSKGKMSFIFLDAETGDVIDVLEDRRLNELIKYFRTYTRAARNAVETICMDMYSPYKELVKALFPNAKIIIDRFHVIQLISRSLNHTRTDVMNSDKKNHKKFKRYWKLILKDENELDDIEFRHYICFKETMRERDVVNYLLDQDTTLKETYELYQDLLHAMKTSKPDKFIELCKNAPDTISSYMKTSIKSILKNEAGVKNSMIYDYSNGVIEGTNNLIKVIKRIAFGYRSFISFKIRILLISNTMVRIGT